MHEQIAASDVSSSAESSLNPHNHQNIAYLLHEVEANAIAFADTLVNNTTESLLRAKFTLFSFNLICRKRTTNCPKLLKNSTIRTKFYRTAYGSMVWTTALLWTNHWKMSPWLSERHKSIKVWQSLVDKCMQIWIFSMTTDIAGIFKYRHDDHLIILQRLIKDLTPRVAITLFPGLPAYILFMCIR